MDEPPFALSMRLALPASIIAKGGSFSTVSTLRLYSSTSLACGFLYEIRTHALAVTSEGFFRTSGVHFISVTNYISHTVNLYHQPHPDFQAFLKSGLLPCTAHRSLQVHDLLPERNLISDIVIYQPIHTI